MLVNLIDHSNVQQEMDIIVAEHREKWRKQQIEKINQFTFPDGSKYSEQQIDDILCLSRPPAIFFLIDKM